MDKIVILYSGGLDSFLAYRYAKKILKIQDSNITLLYVNFGHKYSKNEIKRLPKKTIILDLDIVNYLDKNTHIIPNRNLILCSIGAMFGNEVWLNGLKDEVNGKEKDKSIEFYNKATDLISLTNSYFYNKTIIKSPFINFTKKQLIEYALTNNLATKEEMLDTHSCYNDVSGGCGECVPCVKKMIAFNLLDINVPYFRKGLKSKYFNELLQEIPKAYKNKDYTRFTKNRQLEFMEFLNKNKELIR